MIRPGLYRHYKGNEYRIISLARHSETEEEMVVYQDMKNETKVWVRPLSQFVGNIDVEGRWQPRFTYLGEYHGS